MIGPGVRAVLLAHSGTTDLVAQRIYPKRMPQNPTLPCITYMQVSDLRNGTFDGPDGLPGTLVQVDCWATTVAGVTALYEQVRDALDGYVGSAGDETIQSCALLSATESFETDVETGTGTGGIDRIMCEFRVWWDE